VPPSKHPTREAREATLDHASDSRAARFAGSS
jgi:hypothetical protein